MTWVAAAVVGSAAIGAYSANRASKAQQSAASQASQVAAQTADAQTALQREIFQKQTELQAPFREAGLTGQNRLMALLGLQAPTTFGPQTPWNEGAYRAANPDVAAAIERGEFANAKQHYDMFGREEGRTLGFSPTASTAAGGQRPADFGKYATAEFGADKFKTDPGYAFRMSEGMKALERSAAARGGLLSGATLKGTQRYGQDLASQEYQNAFNRYQTERANTLNPLQSLAGMAQSGANTLGSQAGQMGSNISNTLGAYGSAVQGNIIGSGNAQASGYMGGANAIAGGVGQGINFYQNQQLINRLPNYNTQTLGGGF